MRRALLPLLMLLGAGLALALWLAGDSAGPAGTMQLAPEVASFDGQAPGERGRDRESAARPSALSPGGPSGAAGRGSSAAVEAPRSDADRGWVAGPERGAEPRVPASRTALGDGLPTEVPELAETLAVAGLLRVVDERGEPVADAEVRWLHPKLERGGRTDDEGLRRVLWPEGLGGHWSVAHPAFVDQRGRFESLAPELEVVLVRSCRLEVALEAREGLTVADLAEAEVLLWNSALPARTLRTGIGALHVESDLDPGSYDVFARHARGVARPEFELTLAPGEVRRVDLRLTPGVRLDLTVLDGLGEPLEDVDVLLRPASSGWPAPLIAAQSYRARTDANGSTRFTAGLEGPVVLSAVRPDGRQAREELYWGSEQGTHTLRFPEERERRVRLLAPDGEPAVGVPLRYSASGSGGAPHDLLARERPAGVLEVVSDADGGCELGALPVGRGLALAALAPAGSGWANLWRGPEPLGDGVELRFEHGRTMEIAVHVEGEGALAGVRVSFEAQDATGTWTIASAETNDEGLALLGGLPGRPGRFVGEYRGYRGSPTPCTPIDGGQLSIAVEPKYDLVGRAVDLAGRGLRAVPLEVVREADPDALAAAGASATVTGGNGVFHLRGLRPGAYLLRARSELWRTRGHTALAFRVPSDDPLELTLVESSRDPRASITGRALDRAGAAIDALEIRGANGSRVLRDGARFEVSGLAPRPTTLLLISAGHLPVRLRGLDLRPGQTLDVGEVRFDPALPVCIEVRDREGEPVVGASVRLRPLPEAAGGPAPTSNGEEPPVLTLVGDAQGRYRSAHAMPGKWRVIVAHPDHPRSEQTWAPEPDESGEELFEVELAGSGG